MERLSLRQMARKLGISHQAVAKAVRLGMPMCSPEAAQAWRAGRMILPPPSQQDQALTDAYEAARTRKEIALANLSELRLGEQRGELVRVAEFTSSLASAAASTRDSILQIPARVSAVIAAEPDPAKVHDLLVSELERALSMLALLPSKWGKR